MAALPEPLGAHRALLRAWWCAVALAPLDDVMEAILTPAVRAYGELACGFHEASLESLALHLQRLLAYGIAVQQLLVGSDNIDAAGGAFDPAALHRHLTAHVRALLLDAEIPLRDATAGSVAVLKAAAALDVDVMPRRDGAAPSLAWIWLGRAGRWRHGALLTDARLDPSAEECATAAYWLLHWDVAPCAACPRPLAPPAPPALAQLSDRAAVVQWWQCHITGSPRAPLLRLC